MIALGENYRKLRLSLSMITFLYTYSGIMTCIVGCFFFFSSRRRHTRFDCDWSSDVCSSDLGASGTNDFEEAVATAVINKRAGGTGLISGRKAFQRPMKIGRASCRERV